MAASATSIEYVEKMFIAYFGRPAAPTGLEYYAGLVDAGKVAALQDDFWNSAESQNLFGSHTTEAKINAIFQQLFGRDAAVSGLTYWTTQISSGAVSLPAAALTILNSAGAADLTAFNAKLLVANAFTAQLDTSAEVLSYQQNISGGQALLNTIHTNDDATAALAVIADSVATVVAGGSSNPGSTFTLTVGADNVTGTAGNDTFTAADTTATTWTVGDAVDGGAGTDTLNIIRTAAYTTPVSATVKNIETANVTTGATVTLDATGWTGLTTLNTTGVGGAVVTAAATTDVSVTDSAMVTATDAGIAINGGKNVTATLTAANATTDGDATAEIVVGAVTAAAGTVAVTLTGAYADGADNAMSNIAVVGGTSVNVTTKAGLTAAQTVAQTTDTTNNTITQSAVAVTGDANTTAITVTQDAAVAEVDSATVGKIGIKNGAVTIADKNAASTTAAGTLTTVTLNNYGDSTINSGALNTVNLSGKGGTLGITTGSLTTPAVTTLALNVNGLAYVNAGTNNAITVDADIKTLNIASSTAASTVNNVTATGVTALNVSGDAKLTLTDNTFAALQSVTVTNTAGVTLGTTALGAAVAFTGGAGADSIILSNAFEKAITMGAGDDTVTYGGAASTVAGKLGSMAAGDGTDTIKMTAAQAAAADGDSVFNSSFSGFEVLELGASGANTIVLAGINGVNKVVTGGATGALVLDGFGANGTLKLTADAAGGSYQANVTNALLSATDVFNLDLSKTGGVLAAGTVTAAGVETINITAADASTATGGSAAVIHTATLTANEATKVTVSGNNGLTLTATGSTKVTTFDASGVVANGTAGLDTAANLAVTYTSLNDTAAANVTITGGAGDDVLTGGAAKDAINGGAGNDIINGGLGLDSITVGNGRDIVQITNNDDNTAGDIIGSGTSAADTITGFGLVSTGITGADLGTNAKIQAYTAAGANLTVLNLDVTADDAGAGTGANQALAVEANATGAGQAAGVTYTVTNGILTLGGAGAAAVDTLGEWLVEAAAVAATAGDVLGFQFGSDTYVFAQNGTADVLVQLVGVAGSSLVEVSGATTASAGAILYADL